MFGARIVRAFETVKDAFDPDRHAEPEPDRPPAAHGRPHAVPLRRRATRPITDFTPKLDWSDHPGPLGGMLGAVEMCNNNGTCRAFDAGVMCPSFRVTRDETHLTRGRANTLRLALTGQLGADAMASDAMAEAMAALRVLQGVPARMPDRRRHGEDEDRGAGGARRTAWREMAGDADRGAAALCAVRIAIAGAGEPAQPRAAVALADANAAWASPPRGGCRHGSATGSATRKPRRPPRPRRAARSICWPTPSTATSSRRTCARRCACCAPPAIAPSCRRPTGARCAAAAPCSPSGMVDKAREEARRTMRALPDDLPVIGLEPSCLMTLRDEFRSLLPGAATDALGRTGDAADRVPGAGEARSGAAAAAWHGARARALPPEVVRRVSRMRWRCCALCPELSVTADRVVVLRHGRHVRLSGGDPGDLARDGRGRLAAGGASGGGRTISSWPTAPPAGIRSAICPDARRSTRCGCWSGRWPGDEKADGGRRLKPGGGIGQAENDRSGEIRLNPIT